MHVKKKKQNKKTTTFSCIPGSSAKLLLIGGCPGSYYSSIFTKHDEVAIAATWNHLKLNRIVL